ncbi:BTB/POZ domain-containing protein At1g03010 isoform X1 [Amborella trichopoda]|uniref:BTB/POZ domain-containing protein At1g03010 isoform X1 n=2 Tax=Amborella trichopoda TaxID=13333 RepID=UPI0009BE29E2|nr:BTB/POZ domain-containing protein At1g03010 isoform X1 [Amborella trichopoda]|eukprot:XP_020529703.1 BTB/POZ domain-containing protein At1g03010 isoform X1 [Amborella trichopoda]
MKDISFVIFQWLLQFANYNPFFLFPSFYSCSFHILDFDCRPLSDVSSDLTVNIGAANFSLHKFPLVSRSGKIRKILTEAKDSKASNITLHSFPGGPEAFELAAKFCYGLNIEITLSNVAMLRCASQFLEMTEDFTERNLIYRTESYLKETVIPNISNSIAALHNCEGLLPFAEDTQIIGRCINAISSIASKEQLTSGLSKLESNSLSKPNMALDSEAPSDWWGSSLTKLNLDFFQRVMIALKSKGLKQELLSKILIDYAQNSLQNLGLKDTHVTKGTGNEEPLHKKQRVIVDTIVSLLPTQSRKSSVPIGFLSGLLKVAIMVSASSSCRAELEKRIGLQLDQAILEDILIPLNSNSNGYPTFETETVYRIFSIFLQLDDEDDEGEQLMRDETEMAYEFDSLRSPKQSLFFKVSKLMDSFLAEIAADSSLSALKFIAMTELLPDHARMVTDGLYRAIDIFLKVHPNIKESDRYRLCKTIDCQKLSQEACTHAAQNERLPVQMAVQVLYFEQIRLRNAMNGGHDHYFGAYNTHHTQRSSSGGGSGAISPRDNYASVRRENRELKLEVARMRMRLTDLEKDHVSMRQEMVVRSNPAHKMLHSFTKKLGKLNSLFRAKDSKPVTSKSTSSGRFLFQRRRRHSVS